MNKSQRRTFKQVKDIIYVSDVQSNGYQNTGDNMSIHYEYPEFGCVVIKSGNPSCGRYEYQLQCGGQSVDLPRRKLRRLARLAQHNHEEALVDNINDKLAGATGVLVRSFIDNETGYTGVFEAGSAKECTPSTLMFAIDEFDWFVFDGKCYRLSQRVKSRLIASAEKMGQGR